MISKQKYLKSSEVLDDKVVDCDVDFDRHRVVNTGKITFQNLNIAQTNLLNWVDVKVRNFKGVKRRDAQVRDTWVWKVQIYPGQLNHITCWHLGLEQFEDGCNVLINCRIPEAQPLPKGRKGKQGQHNPVNASN